MEYAYFPAMEWVVTYVRIHSTHKTVGKKYLYISSEILKYTSDGCVTIPWGHGSGDVNDSGAVSHMTVTTWWM